MPWDFCWCRHKCFVKGTKKIDTSIGEQKVTIVCGSKKANYDAYVAAFKKIGYEIKKRK